MSREYRIDQGSVLFEALNKPTFLALLYYFSYTDNEGKKTREWYVSQSLFSLLYSCSPKSYFHNYKLLQQTPIEIKSTISKPYATRTKFLSENILSDLLEEPSGTKNPRSHKYHHISLSLLQYTFPTVPGTIEGKQTQLPFLTIRVNPGQFDKITSLFRLLQSPKFMGLVTLSLSLRQGIQYSNEMIQEDELTTELYLNHIYRFNLGVYANPDRARTLIRTSDLFEIKYQYFETGKPVSYRIKYSGVRLEFTHNSADFLEEHGFLVQSFE